MLCRRKFCGKSIHVRCKYASDTREAILSPSPIASRVLSANFMTARRQWRYMVQIRPVWRARHQRDPATRHWPARSIFVTPKRDDGPLKLAGLMYFSGEIIFFTSLLVGAMFGWLLGTMARRTGFSLASDICRWHHCGIYRLLADARVA